MFLSGVVLAALLKKFNKVFSWNHHEYFLGEKALEKFSSFYKSVEITEKSLMF